MKLAITGKGGVGKTSLTALLALSFARAGRKVIAVDADPATTLARTLGIPNPESITPISELHELIEERMGVQPDSIGTFFRLNPKVDDLPEKYWVEHDGIRLLIMGTISRGGTGCACPANALLKALLMHLLIARDEVVILDMEAGVEHLGRATATAVDAFIIVLEPSRQSIETGRKIAQLAKDISIKRIFVVGNKVRSEIECDFIRENVDFGTMTICLPYSDEVVLSAMEGSGRIKPAADIVDGIEKLKETISKQY
ncbi:TPA: carbon monoxide dehydrogenase [Candidatus Poribacteria bacterium]|nr:carbon monoxide dehydrogenase [Candidatus Poribacteria bacterium]